jgi:hypothetical protein
MCTSERTGLVQIQELLTLYFIGPQPDSAYILALRHLHLRGKACAVAMRPDEGCGLEARSTWDQKFRCLSRRRVSKFPQVRVLQMLAGGPQSWGAWAWRRLCREAATIYSRVGVVAGCRANGVRAKFRLRVRASVRWFS